MKIGIIGTDGVRVFAQEIGAEAKDIRGVVSDAEVIILAIPLPAMRELPADLFDRAPLEVTIIDTSNYYPGLRDSRIPEIDDGLPESDSASAIAWAISPLYSITTSTSPESSRS